MFLIKEHTMFLVHLDKDEQKKLFLQLATIVMMAEGDASTASKSINDNNTDNDDHTLGFFQSLSEDELLALGSYALECRYIDASSYKRGGDQFGKEEVYKDIISTSKQSIGLREALAKQIAITIGRNSNKQDIKKQVMENFIANDGDLTNLDGDVMKSELLKLPQLKAEALEGTARTVIRESEASLDDKTKKIILFELIGAGFSDGYFDDSEKQLFQKICQWLDIEEEYVDEFLELATSFFTLTNDITDLINEQEKNYAHPSDYWRRIRRCRFI